MSGKKSLWSRTKKWLGILLLCLLALSFTKVAWVWKFRTTGQQALQQKDTEDLLARRAYLVEQIVRKKIDVKDMPSLIGPQFQGEWALVSYSMTAVALTNLAFLVPSTRASALSALDVIVASILKPSFRAFDTELWREDPLKSLPGKNAHIGYLGHLNLALAARHFLSPSSPYRGLFHRVSEALARRYKAQSYGCLPTYPDEFYVPDNTAAVASLALYDRLFPKRATKVASSWLAIAKRKYVDPKSGLFVFRLDERGRVLQASRGSGSAWNLFYLWYVQEAFARRQYAKLRKHFFKNLGPFGGIREWLDPSREGDIDSGPLLFGMSPAASGFAVAAARFSQDATTLHKLLLSAEAAGFTWESNSKRRYLVAPFVGNAILLAMRTVTSWDARYLRHHKPTKKSQRNTKAKEH